MQQLSSSTQEEALYIYEKEHRLRFLGNPGPEESMGTAVIPACPPIWDKWPANGIRPSLHTTSPPLFLLQHLTSSTDRMKEKKGFFVTSKMKRLLQPSMVWSSYSLASIFVALFSCTPFISAYCFLLPSCVLFSIALYMKSPWPELFHLHRNNDPTRIDHQVKIYFLSQVISVVFPVRYRLWRNFCMSFY